MNFRNRIEREQSRLERMLHDAQNAKEAAPNMLADAILAGAKDGEDKAKASIAMRDYYQAANKAEDCMIEMERAIHAFRKLCNAYQPL